MSDLRLIKVPFTEKEEAKSLADKTHNAEAILQYYKEIGSEIWSRFDSGKGGIF